MIVRSLKEIQSTDRNVRAETWESARLLTAHDNMGFSFHITTLYPGCETRMQYKHHLEAVYCLEGWGELEDLAAGTRHVIVPGVMYALDRHDRHVMRVEERMVVVCVFNPALRGDETHDADGSYPPSYS